jgi:hypothetical protein
MEFNIRNSVRVLTRPAYRYTEASSEAAVDNGLRGGEVVLYAQGKSIRQLIRGSLSLLGYTKFRIISVLHHAWPKAKDATISRNDLNHLVTTTVRLVWVRPTS